MRLQCSADFQRAIERFFCAPVKDERHAVARRTLSQSAGCIRISKSLCAPNNLVKRITQSALLVNQMRRVIHDVHEKNVPNLELDLYLDLTGHLVARAKLRNLVTPRRSSVESEAGKKGA